MINPPQLDETFVMGTELGASVTRKNQPILQAGQAVNGAVLSYTAANLVTGVNGTRHIVQIDLSLTFPGNLSFTEIINAITVDTLPAPGSPPMHTDVITPGNEGLNISDQLDFRLTMSYPASADPTATYAVRIRINGNYE